MKLFELLPRPLGNIFRKLTHFTCNSPNQHVSPAVIDRWTLPPETFSSCPVFAFTTWHGNDNVKPQLPVRSAWSETKSPSISTSESGEKHFSKRTPPFNSRSY